MNFHIHNNSKQVIKRPQIFIPSTTIISKAFIIRNLCNIQTQILKEVAFHLGNSRKNAKNTRPFLEQFIKDKDFAQIDFKAVMLKNIGLKKIIDTDSDSDTEYEIKSP